MSDLIDFDNPDSFENKISNILQKLDLKLNENALNFYNSSNRNSDDINTIEDSKISDLYNFLKNKSII